MPMPDHWIKAGKGQPLLFYSCLTTHGPIYTRQPDPFTCSKSQFTRTVDYSARDSQNGMAPSRMQLHSLQASTWNTFYYPALV